MEWHHTTLLKQKKSQKQCPQPVRPWELFFGMLKDVDWLGFCHMGKPLMLSLPSDAAEAFSCTV
jgi:hypothetical protein